MFQIEYEDKIIEYQIIKAKIKNLYIKIKEGKVIVKAPFYLRTQEIEDFVNKKKKWIYKSLKDSREKEKQETKKYTNEELSSFADKVEKISKEYIKLTGLQPNKIRIRDIKYAWGSCSSNKNITINAKVIQKEDEFIKYVILHELCHLKYMNHSNEFWKLVEKYMPEYKEVKRRNI